jgi:lipoprotein-anchoring transpeptidase ErfK/SrfK
MSKSATQMKRAASFLTAIATASLLLVATAQARTHSRASADASGARGSKAAVLVDIDKETQRMTVSVGGRQLYEWPVSTGRPGYSTPSGSFTATSMNAIWYSKQWDNAPMPHSVFFIKDGHAIHGSSDIRNLGKPVSHGCVRLLPRNAATLYALVKENGLENTRVVVSGVSPGGEYGVAGAQANPRPGFLEPLFGLPFFNGPRGN